MTEVTEDSGIGKSKDKKEELQKIEVKIIEQNNFRARVEIDSIVHEVSFYSDENKRFSPPLFKF